MGSEHSGGLSGWICVNTCTILFTSTVRIGRMRGDVDTACVSHSGSMVNLDFQDSFSSFRH